MIKYLRGAAWTFGALPGALLIVFASSWFAWQRDPAPYTSATNALWARHQWVGEPHTREQYRALADTLTRNRITDVFFHAGPFDGDGGIPPARYAHARELLATLRTFAPGVRAQAYVGQVERSGGGRLDLRNPATRGRILRTAETLLDLGFGGIHYDIEPIYPDTASGTAGAWFLDLLERTHRLTAARGRVLSAAVEQPTLADWTQPIFHALLPRAQSRIHYPPRPTRAYLRAVADRVDQVAVMTYDSELPTQSLAGRHFARHTERVLELIGDRVTVFVGVPTYRPITHWAEDLPTALRGVRQGIGALRHPPRRPYGVGLYAEWTTNHHDWVTYRKEWLGAGP